MKHQDVSAFGDMDDAEIVGYLHTKKEVEFKKILWELINKDYMKRKRTKSATKAKKKATINPAQKAVKIAGDKENGKIKRTPMMSLKINYDALRKVMEEEEDLGLNFGNLVKDQTQNSSTKQHSSGRDEEGSDHKFEHEMSSAYNEEGGEYQDNFLCDDEDQDDYCYYDDCDYEGY